MEADWSKMVNSMTTRERFHAVMNAQPFDRLPVVEWAAWWNQTIDRWHEEKLPADVTERYDIVRHFGLDVYCQASLAHTTPACPRPEHHGAGILTTMEDYDRIRPELLPWPPPNRDAMLRAFEQWAQLQEKGEAVIWFTVQGFFWWPRTLFGIEQHLYGFYDQAELMHRMNQDLAEWQLKVFDDMANVCEPDFMSFAEDMSYNHGPMLSKDLFEEFMTPYYRQVVPRLDELGIIPIVDSDGDITVPAEWFRDAGVRGILPLERQAGVDVAQLRDRYPDMCWIGCFDKMTMNQGEAAMCAEFERLLPAAAKGRLIISCDHQTPPGVSYDDYQLYLRLFREYGAEAGRLSAQLVERGG